MQLINAQVTARRNVTTKYGERTVVDALATDGRELTLWRPAGDHATSRLRDGDRVTVGVDARGKCSLVETSADRTPTAVASDPTRQAQPMGFAVEEAAPETTRSAEIADYIQRLGKLYNGCYRTASSQLGAELDTSEVKDVATTIFIQTVRHFGL
jgi:hypothetical protein